MAIGAGSAVFQKCRTRFRCTCSITKIMSSLLAAEQHLHESKIVMSQSAAYGITISDSSSIYADTGEEFTTEQAMMAVMLSQPMK